MANSTTNLDLIATAQAQKEVTANALFDACSPATLFGRRANTTAALTWGYYGGVVMVDGVPTQINNGTVALTANATNYIEATRTGVVSANTTGFTPGRTPLYTVVTGASTVTSYTDHRVPIRPTGRLSLSVASADVTLTAAQAACDILEFTGALTANRTVTVPAGPQQWMVHNATTGPHTLTIKTATGLGVAIPQGARVPVYANGTDVVAASPLVATPNGATWMLGQSSELITLSTSSNVTNSATMLLPAGAIIEAVVALVTVAIAGATAWRMGDANVSDRFTDDLTGLAAGTTAVGLNHVDRTGLGGPRQTTAAALRITTTGTPTAGRILVTVFYRRFTAPVS